MNKLCVFACLALALGCAEAGDASDDDGGPGGAGGQGGQGAAGGQGGVGGGGFGGAGGGGFGGAGGGAPRNQRPDLRRIGDREAPVGEQLEIKLEATDPEGATLAYNVRSSLPEGAKFEKPTGTFTWTPTPAQEGTIVLITFEVTDGMLKDQETIQITVVAAGAGGNRPPLFDEIGDQVVAPGRPFMLQLEATDPNGDEITYSMRGDMLEGAVLDAASGLFQWTPGEALAGQSFNVTFVATDGMGDAMADVKFVVRDSGGSPQNLPPRITPIDDQEVRAGEELRITVTAEDDNPESLMYSTAGPVPPGANFDSATATLTWTPTEDQANQAFPVVFQVSDGQFRAVERVSIQVRPGMGGPGPDECVPDAQEGMEPLMVAANDRYMRNICPIAEVDEYLVPLQIGQRLTVTMTLINANGDLDLELFGPNEAFIESSDDTDDEEQIVHDVAIAGNHKVLVLGFDPNDYTINFQIEDGVEPPPECMDDADDGGLGNDNANSAADLRAAVDQPRQICADDADFYEVDLTAGADVTIEMAFSHGMGDIDARLFQPVPLQVLRAVSSDDNEVFELSPVPVTGTYILEVYGYQGAENSYTLSLDEGQPPMCEADRLEPNNNIGQSQNLPDELYRNLTLCGDEDWFRTPVPEGGTLRVGVSYDGTAPTIEAFTPNNMLIEDAVVGVGEGEGCQVGRSECRIMRVEGAPGGDLHYKITGGDVGAVYDIEVDVDMPMMGDMCSLENQDCADLEVCDYPNGQCVDGFCDRNGVGCTDDYICVAEWCLDLCEDDGSCVHPERRCKHIGGDDFCAPFWDREIGESCLDFTDCVGSLDCIDTPGGYCSRECDSDMDCEGGVCATFENGNFCGKPCDDHPECRDGYSCGVRPRSDGASNTSICVPGIEI